MKTISLLAIALALTLALTGSAFAQTSRDAYSGQGGQVQGQVEGENQQPVVASSGGSSGGGGGSLPFTGLDLAFLAGGGALLLAAGLTMRRLTLGSRST